ncbi:hypothetical protein LXL04_015321 [Taraxacum kok-saghyz]
MLRQKFYSISESPSTSSSTFRFLGSLFGSFSLKPIDITTCSSIKLSMEVAGVALRQAPCFSSSGADAFNSRHLSSFPTVKSSRSFCLKQTRSVKSLVASVSFDEFSDKSHLQYYNGPKMAVKEKEVAAKKKDMKKKLKLLKGLSKNLSIFSDIGFGLNPADGLDHQVKGQMISEATEVLLGQLQKLKAEEMESKKMKKEEKAKKKAAKLMMVCNESSSSSSESSCSSESDCENIVDMKQLKTVSTPNQEATPALRVAEIPSSNPSNISVSVDERSNKIEVCMGGKCKKSGAEMLLENFQKAVGGETAAAVVGCKCMGKCRNAPNVRVKTSNGDGDGNPLCLGVGLEDVDSIVANFFGGNQRCGSDIVPAMSNGSLCDVRLSFLMPESDYNREMENFQPSLQHILRNDLIAVARFSSQGNSVEIGKSRRDKWLIPEAPKGVYSTDWLRNCLETHKTMGQIQRNHWNKWIPKKHNVLVWRLIRDRVPTRILHSIHTSCDIFDLIVTTEGRWLQVVIAAVFVTIWHFRNGAIFDNKKLEVEKEFRKVQELAYFWISNRNSKFDLELNK